MKLGSWCFAFALFALLVVGVCFTYLIRGTTIIGDFVSPDGVHDAVLMVRDGGAVTGYITGISLLPHNSLARHLAFMRGINLFVVDDNEGAVRWGDRGQLEVKISWVSNTQLLVQYPAEARVFKREASYQSMTVRYEASP